MTSSNRSLFLLLVLLLLHLHLHLFVPRFVPLVYDINRYFLHLHLVLLLLLVLVLVVVYPNRFLLCL